MSVKGRDMSVKHMNIDEFRDLGVLQELNRLFLHPLGLAMEITAKGGKSHISGIWDYRDDPEGILFGRLNREKMKRFKAFAKRQRARRKAAIGYIIQKADLP